mmetsp:Transcript_50482/g.93350  ORF Transcript_50482/g.93350 Transcript_50482/m.93350 type:complete len:389 (+) Transcript_50482:59-1225(+)
MSDAPDPLWEEYIEQKDYAVSQHAASRDQAVPKMVEAAKKLVTALLGDWIHLPELASMLWGLVADAADTDTEEHKVKRRQTKYDPETKTFKGVLVWGVKFNQMKQTAFRKRRTVHYSEVTIYLWNRRALNDAAAEVDRQALACTTPEELYNFLTENKRTLGEGKPTLVRRCMVMGTAGDGKSTLVNYCCGLKPGQKKDSHGRVAAPVGVCSRGVTKCLTTYQGLPIGIYETEYLDTPGIGDLDIKKEYLRDMVQDLFASGQRIQALIITTAATQGGRIADGTIKLVEEFVDAGIIAEMGGKHGYANVIFVVAKSDASTPQQREQVQQYIEEKYRGAKCCFAGFKSKQGKWSPPDPNTGALTGDYVCEDLFDTIGSLPLVRQTCIRPTP